MLAKRAKNCILMFKSIRVCWGSHAQREGFAARAGGGWDAKSPIAATGTTIGDCFCGAFLPRCEAFSARTGLLAGSRSGSRLSGKLGSRCGGLDIIDDIVGVLFGRRNKEAAGNCQNDEDAGERPRSLLHEVRGLADTEYAVGTSYARCQTATLGFLNEYDGCKQNRYDYCKHYNRSVHGGWLVDYDCL